MKPALIAILLCLLIRPDLRSQSLASDSLALVALYHATNGPNWTRNTNWLTGPITTWYGVSLRNGRVDVISLYANNLDGELPPELGSLSALREIWVHFNKLRGEVPETLSDLSELEVLYINDNQLSGPLRASWGRYSKMIEFYVNNNRFTGTIPPELGNMTPTQLFNVSGNLLTGTIPPELGNFPDLRRMCLWGNDLTGSIPPELMRLTSLRILQIDNNRLSGPIPDEISNLRHLTELRAHNNDLSGPLPAGLGTITTLRTLNLSRNRLTGTIPASVLQLPVLVSMQLHDNLFDAAEPATPRTGLTQLNVKGNRLSFAHVLPLAGRATVTTLYPQEPFGSERSDTLFSGDPFAIDFGASHPDDVWTWFRNGEPLTHAAGPTLAIGSVTTADAGLYRADVRNAAAPGIVLQSRTIRLVVDGVTDADRSDIPPTFGLLSTYPNPFNPTTQIRFTLDAGRQTRLTVHDLLGREVAVLAEGWMPAGEHRAVFDARHLASGVYVIRLMTPEGGDSRTVSLVK